MDIGEHASLPPKVKLVNIVKSFTMDELTLPVLRLTEFYAGQGEFVSVVGPSGCGKSTLLNIIAGLEEPNEGSILLDGRPAADRLGQIGYMHQKDLLLPWRNVLDNAILGLEVRGVSRGVARRRAGALMEQFGLNGFETSYPWALSGGMRQRAAFLRTVLVDQSVILLDEPFGSLDALTRIQMQEWLLHIWDDFRKTVILVTHDVDEAILMSDRVYILTSRPGQVKLEFPVDLPRPRLNDMITSPEFVEMKAKVMAAIYREDMKAPEKPTEKRE